MSSDSTHSRRAFPIGAAFAMSVAGAGFVVLGGLVAAVTDPLDLARGSWLAAYLVLVGGVAQYAMGWVERRQSTETTEASSLPWARFGGWNLGNAAVVIGTLASAPLLVDLGSVLLVFVLVTALKATWSGAAWSGPQSPTLVVWTYRILLIILIVSIPVGILLSYLRNG